MEEGLFRKDLPDSLFKRYHPNGKLAAEILFSGGKLKKEVCYDETGYKRNCAAFRSRGATLPINFAHFYKEYFTFSRRDYKVADSILYLQVVIDRDGGYYFFSLFKRSDGATGKLASNRSFWETLKGEAPKLEAVGSLQLRDDIKDRLMKLPKAIPAYEGNIAIPSLRVFEIWFRE
jgi:antitoxin component YwqK of YwqJK toxin-antitoxin module